MFKLTVLGCGTMMPTKDRNPAGFLLEWSGGKILLDCGHGIIRRMVDYGIDPQELDAIFISHYHTDHFGDAFNLIHARWVQDVYEGREHRPLKIFGPIGLAERFAWWRKIYWPEPNESYPLEFIEGAYKGSLGEVNLDIFDVCHVAWFKSVAVAISCGDKKIAYTGDIGSQTDGKALAEKTYKSDLLITEASYQHRTPNHYTIAQVEELKKEADIDKVLVVHIRPQHLAVVEDFCSRNKDFIINFGEWEKNPRL